MLARKSMMISPTDAKWVDKQQETNPLAERRNVKVSVKIPAVLGTGLMNDQILYVRSIDTSTMRLKSMETSPVQASPTDVLTVTNDDVQTPEVLWEDDSFMYTMFF
jgi:hypothetical protein